MPRDENEPSRSLLAPPAMAHAGPLGSETNPIPRSAFNRVILENFIELDAEGRVTGVKPESGVRGFAKVAPTLVLYPSAEDMTAGGQPGMRGADESETPDFIKTLLTKKGRTYEESLPKIYGKALLLNFCSPSVEMYPKDIPDCKKIYIMEAVDANIVPEAALASDDALKDYLVGQLQHMGHSRPLKLRGEFDLPYAQILRAMIHSRGGTDRPALPMGAPGARPQCRWQRLLQAGTFDELLESSTPAPPPLYRPRRRC